MASVSDMSMGDAVVVGGSSVAMELAETFGWLGFSTDWFLWLFCLSYIVTLACGFYLGYSVRGCCARASSTLSDTSSRTTPSDTSGTPSDTSSTLSDKVLTVSQNEDFLRLHAGSRLHLGSVCSGCVHAKPGLDRSKSMKICTVCIQLKLAELDK